MPELSDNKRFLVFFNEWCGNGLNAKKAYQKIHPDVTERSAQTLGSRMLRRVDTLDILDRYGLGIDIYMKQLKLGLNAELGSSRKPDHKVRRHYHKVLGKLLKKEDQEDDVTDLPVVRWGEKIYYVITPRLLYLFLMPCIDLRVSFI